MTKHFRKEHPADSIDQEEDADYSDIEQSDDEPSLDQDGEDSPDSADYLQDPEIKSEAPVNAAASNYDANLWRLPAQTAQRPGPNRTSMNADLRSGISAQTVKMERSLSGTSQRDLTDPAMRANRYINTRANTLPNDMSRSPSVDMAMWQAQHLHESPTGMTQPRNYPMQGMNVPTSAPTQFQHMALPIRRPSLQPVHDIILDEPQQAHYSQAPQQSYAAIPNSQYGHPPPNFRDEMPRTPDPGQQLPQFSSSMDHNGPYQPPQALPMEEYNLPTLNMYNLPPSQGVSMYHNPIDVYKEDLKLEDSWTQMPSAVGWGI